MIRVAAFVVLLVLVAPAAAQVIGALPPAAPSLKRSATVSSDIVRIGDLIDNAGPVANVPIFRSPDIGTTGTVPVEKVIEAARAHLLLGIDTGALVEVEVTRAGRFIGMKDIEARIAQAFAGQYGLGEAKNLTVTLDRGARPIVVEVSVTSDLQLLRADFDRRSGRFDVVFDVPGSAAARRTAMRYTGTLVDTIEAAVLTRDLARGDVVKTSDVAIERRPKAPILGDVVGATTPAVGLAARHSLRAGQPLHRSDLIKPELVHRNENVTLVYEVPGIMLTTRAKALESGAQGELINVLNVQSKRTVQGTVSGPGRITIAVTTSRLLSDTASLSVPAQTIASRWSAE